MVHLVEHLLEGARDAGHLQPHVEAFGHAQLAHHVGQLLLGHVDRAGGAHLAGQLQPVFVDIGDHHVARTHMAADGGSHDADRTRPGDEHIFTHQIEGEGGVHRIAERVEDGGQLVRDVVRQLEGVECGDHQILGKGARAVDANTNGVAAEVSAASAAVTAVTAGDMPFTGDPIADGEAAHLLTDSDHFPNIFVADHHGYRNGLLGPLVPVVDMDIGAADGGFADLDQQVVVAELGGRHIRHPDADLFVQFGECFHGCSFNMNAEKRGCSPLIQIR